MVDFIFNRPKLIYSTLIVYWLILLLATSLPSSSVPSLSVSDKLQHFFAYAVLGLLFFLSLCIQKKYPMTRTKIIISAILVLLTYAAFDELHQMLIPGRFCEFYDWIANAAGTFAGIGSGNFLLSFKKNC